jgi:L-aminopeptidase/D-esterase-like protein
MRSAMKGGVGTWAVNLPGGVIVGALVVVNAFGDVLDEHTGQVLAGARDPATGRFLNTADALIRGQRAPAFTANSTLGVVATNAALTKEQANKLAQLGHDGLARVISPVHTMVDGDTLFALSTGTAKADAMAVGAAAVQAIAESVKRAVQLATGLAGIAGLADAG